MKKIIEIKQHDQELMHITWLINNICPNSCSYCPAILHEGTNHHYDWNNARRFFEYLFERYPKIHCSVGGGEASVSPFFKEICQTFAEAGHTIGVTSNAAKPASYWKEISPNLNFICFSYHAEFPDINFREKVLAAAANTSVTVRIMMHPKYWDHCMEMYNLFDSYEYLYTEPVRLYNWGVSDLYIYSDEQIDFFEKYKRPLKNQTTPPGGVFPKINAEMIFSDGTSEYYPNTIDYVNGGYCKFAGWECEIGLKSMFVSWDGEVLLGNCGVGGSIGNINDPENIKWPTGPVICTKNDCTCTIDVNINKRIK